MKNISINQLQIRLFCPPQIKYDFIGKFETLHYDMEYILKKLGINIPWPNDQPRTNADYIRLYYHGLPKEHLQELYKIYGTDFDVSNLTFFCFLNIRWFIF